MSKFTIELGPKSEATLKRLAEEQGAPQTEIVRRALGVYAVLADEAEKGNRVILEEPSGRHREIIAP
jgi:hypothetical protein